MSAVRLSVQLANESWLQCPWLHNSMASHADRARPGLYSGIESGMSRASYIGQGLESGSEAEPAPVLLDHAVLIPLKTTEHFHSYCQKQAYK